MRTESDLCGPDAGARIGFNALVPQDRLAVTRPPPAEPPPAPDAPDRRKGTSVRQLRAAIIVPVYRDWPCFAQLLAAIDAALGAADARALVVAVNDQPGAGAGTEVYDLAQLANVAQLEILHLARNLGHQRAIAIGLSHVEASYDCECVIVMDADGEDRPEDLPRLLDAFRRHPDSLIVAERLKRSEGRLFRTCYAGYKSVFRLLTGQHVSFGNFSLIPRDRLVHVVSMSEIWNNLPAGLIQSRLPLVRLPTERGVRYAGRSSMSFVSLVVHGLGAISVFSEAVFVRVSLFSVGFLALSAAIIAVVLGLKATGHATPGWASNVALSLSILAVQMVMLSVVAAFVVLNNRTAMTVIPRVNYRHFLLRRELVWAEPAERPAPQRTAR